MQLEPTSSFLCFNEQALKHGPPPSLVTIIQPGTGSQGLDYQDQNSTDQRNTEIHARFVVYEKSGNFVLDVPENGVNVDEMSDGMTQLHLGLSSCRSNGLFPSSCRSLAPFPPALNIQSRDGGSERVCVPACRKAASPVGASGRTSPHSSACKDRMLRCSWFPAGGNNTLHFWAFYTII